MTLGRRPGVTALGWEVSRYREAACPIVPANAALAASAARADSAASVVNIEGLRLSSETYNSLGFDEGAHERTHQHMRATHTSDLHKCPHSPGMPPRDLRERQARTSPEG